MNKEQRVWHLHLFTFMEQKTPQIFQEIGHHLAPLFHKKE